MVSKVDLYIETELHKERLARNGALVRTRQAAVETPKIRKTRAKSRFRMTTKHGEIDIPRQFVMDRRETPKE